MFSCYSCKLVIGSNVLMLDFGGPDYLGVRETMFIRHMQNTHLSGILKNAVLKTVKRLNINFNRLIHLLITEIFLYYGAQKFLY